MPLDPLFPFKRLLDIIHWRGAFMLSTCTRPYNRRQIIRHSRQILHHDMAFTEIQAVEHLYTSRFLVVVSYLSKLSVSLE